MSQIFKRSLTAIFFLIVLTSVYYYGNNISMLAIIYSITLLSFYEWISMESLSKIKTILFFTLILVIPFIDIINMYFISFFSLCLWIFLIIYMLIDSEQLKKLVKRYHTLFGFLIFSILFLHLANLFPISNTININDLSNVPIKHAGVLGVTANCYKMKLDAFATKSRVCMCVRARALMPPSMH